MTNREYLGSMSIDDMLITMLNTVGDKDCDGACLADYIAGENVNCPEVCGGCEKCIREVLDMETRRKHNE